MKRICFVCLGNICRSPMAEFIMKDKVKKLGLENEYLIESRGTSDEEYGNDMYPPAKRMLDEKNIPYTTHKATPLLESDYDKYDYFICMEESNIRNISYIFNDKNKKVRKLLDRDISDPWYTRNFISTYNDLVEGIDLLLNDIITKK